MTTTNRGRVARGVLSLFTTPARADVLASEVAADSASRALISYWLLLVRAGCSLLIREFRTFPVRLFWLTAVGHAVAIALNYTFVYARSWLLHRPYDQSFLASFWVRSIAQACSSVGAARAWEYAVGPFTVGLLVAWISRGRELVVCVALLVSELLAIEIAHALNGHVWPAMVSTFVFVPLRYFMLFAACIIVRMTRH